MPVPCVLACSGRPASSPKSIMATVQAEVLQELAGLRGLDVTVIRDLVGLVLDFLDHPQASTDGNSSAFIAPSSGLILPLFPCHSQSAVLQDGLVTLSERDGVPMSSLKVRSRTFSCLPVWWGNY